MTCLVRVVSTAEVSSLCGSGSGTPDYPAGRAVLVWRELLPTPFPDVSRRFRKSEWTNRVLDRRVWGLFLTFVVLIFLENCIFCGTLYERLHWSPRFFVILLLINLHNDSYSLENTFLSFFAPCR